MKKCSIKSRLDLDFGALTAMFMQYKIFSSDCHWKYLSMNEKGIEKLISAKTNV